MFYLLSIHKDARTCWQIKNDHVAYIGIYEIRAYILWNQLSDYRVNVCFLVIHAYWPLSSA